MPADAFLTNYPVPIHAAANALRALVVEAVPAAVERVRVGWRLIGYDVPIGRRTRYFAYVAPEVEHVHLGFEYGAWMADPDRLLEGGHLGLRRVRYMTLRPGEAIPEQPLAELTREAARIALMSERERVALFLDREAGPPRRR